MANFVITAISKPTSPSSSELKASKSKDVGSGMEEAFDSLMTNKQSTPARPVGEQDSNRRHHQHNEHHHAHKHDDAKRRDNQLQHGRQLQGQFVRQPLQQPHLPVAIAPEQLIQRRHEGGGQQGQQQEQQQEQAEKLQKLSLSTDGKADTFQDTLQDNHSLADMDSSISEDVGSVFDEIDLDEPSQEPVQLGDEPSMAEILSNGASGGSAGDHAGQREKPLVWHKFQQGSSQFSNIPGNVQEQFQNQFKKESTEVFDKENGVPHHSAEESQLVAAALEKKQGHYPEGSVGRALQEGKLNQEALHKLFAQWKAQREAQEKHMPHHKQHAPLHFSKPHHLLMPMLNPDHLNPEQTLSGGRQATDESDSSRQAELAEAAEKVFEYLRERIIESVWDVSGHNGLTEGVVVNLQGDLVNGSRFLIKKVNDRIEVTFYIKDERFMKLAEGFHNNLTESIRKKCEVGQVEIKYHLLSSEAGASGAAMNNQSQADQNAFDSHDEEEDNLWGE